MAPRRDPETKTVMWKGGTLAGHLSQVHDVSFPQPDRCGRCHFAGNSLGAAAMALPAKSVLCMPCHTATLTAGDTVTLLALMGFVLAIAGIFPVWLSGTVAGPHTDTTRGKIPTLVRNAGRTLFSPRIGPVVKALFFDGFLQRRLYRRSPGRWIIHGLIFWPFVIRFVWGMIALTLSKMAPAWPVTWALVDKNHPATALVFDVSGLMLAAGIGIAMIRGRRQTAASMPDLPPRDLPALVLLGGIVAAGFFLEGIRMALTGADGAAAFAFVGYGLSRLFAGLTGLDGIYGYLWYGHAVLTAAAVVYLPFSRLMHVILAPVVMAVNAASGHREHA